MTEPLDDLMAQILDQMNRAIHYESAIAALHLVILSLGKDGKLVVPGAKALYPLVRMKGYMIKVDVNKNEDLVLTIVERTVGDVPIN